eukprot:4611203-Prymnesium_polylepis.1
MPSPEPPSPEPRPPLTTQPNQARMSEPCFDSPSLALRPPLPIPTLRPCPPTVLVARYRPISATKRMCSPTDLGVSGCLLAQPLFKRGFPSFPAVAARRQVLFAIGRTPVTDTLGLDAAGIECTKRGIICVDKLGRTTVDGV